MIRIAIVGIVMTLGLSSSQCQAVSKNNKILNTAQKKKQLDDYETAYFASGCFWCVEAIFESVNGVKEVFSGYSGGTAKNANYAAVSYGLTKHAEAVEVYYDPNIVSYETLLEVFFGSHDPTTLNQQGPDKGPQYRSAIFYTSQEEKNAAETYVSSLIENNVFSSITTEIVPFEAFYLAEEYHQDYEQKNPNQSYVRAVSIPRLNRFKKKFPQFLKEGAEH